LAIDSALLPHYDQIWKNALNSANNTMDDQAENLMAMNA